MFCGGPAVAANLLHGADVHLDALGSGDGVSIVADGNTVYGTDTSLYVAGDERGGWPRRR